MLLVLLELLVLLRRLASQGAWWGWRWGWSELVLATVGRELSGLEVLAALLEVLLECLLRRPRRSLARSLCQGWKKHFVSDHCRRQNHFSCSRWDGVGRRPDLSVPEKVLSVSIPRPRSGPYSPPSAGGAGRAAAGCA